MPSSPKRSAAKARIARLARREADLICAIAARQQLAAALEAEAPYTQYARRMAVAEIVAAAMAEGELRERWRRAYRSVFGHEPTSYRT